MGCDANEIGRYDRGRWESAFIGWGGKASLTKRLNNVGRKMELTLLRVTIDYDSNQDNRCRLRLSQQRVSYGHPNFDNFYSYLVFFPSWAQERLTSQLPMQFNGTR